MNVHKNARLTPKGREAMVRDVTDRGLTQAEAARRHYTTPKTVAKWVRRFRGHFMSLQGGCLDAANEEPIPSGIS